MEFISSNKGSFKLFYHRFIDVKQIGYEPAGLTMHPPPPQNDRGWVHFFRMGV